MPIKVDCCPVCYEVHDFTSAHAEVSTKRKWMKRVFSTLGLTPGIIEGIIAGLETAPNPDYRIQRALLWARKIKQWKAGD